MSLIKRHARRLWRQKVKRPARVFLHGLTTHQCPDCKKTVELFHVCAPKSDFKRRRGRQAAAEKRRANRKTTAGKTAGKPARRQRGERRADHYKTCSDPDCQRQLCIVFRAGRDSCPPSMTRENRDVPGTDRRSGIVEISSPFCRIGRYVHP